MKQNIIYYTVEKVEGEDIRTINLYHNNNFLAELKCYNDLLGDWEEIDLFLEQEDLYDVYGTDVEFVKQ